MAPHVKSKRKTLRLKHKIEKKVREHHRKVRRSNKAKVAGPTRKNKRKDPGIPNLWPYKRELMDDLERKRQEARAAKNARARKNARANERRADAKASIADLASDAVRRGVDFESLAGAEGLDANHSKQVETSTDSSRRAFMQEFRRVVESSDVILEVLDARDPHGCRCLDAERAVVAASGGTKRIVLVLNKVDLVPREVAEKWLAYLRNDFPTVAFRASIQGGRSAGGRVGQADMDALDAGSSGTTEALGAGTLMSVLKNYARSKNIKTSIAVGVIGFPNVGKSSLINSLKRSKVVSTGAMPGLTRNAQEIQLDKNIRLIDCPGIVFSDEHADALVLRNCIKIENLADPISPVDIILKRVGPEPLMEAYSIPAFDNLAEFLALIAKSRGKYKRGGALDILAAAVVVLQDWNGGKIPFYTLPPKGPRLAHLSASVVNEWSREFDINASTKEAEGAALDSVSGPHVLDKAQFAEVTNLTEAAVGDIDVEDLGVDAEEDDNEINHEDALLSIKDVVAMEEIQDDPSAPQNEIAEREQPNEKGTEQTYHAASVVSDRRRRRNPSRTTRSSHANMQT